MRESELMNAVIEAARILGWRVAHFRPSMTRHGWRTAVQADGVGYPDLTLVRDRVLFAELKVGSGRLRPEQALWLDALRAAGAEVYLWREADWTSGSVEEALR